MRRSPFYDLDPPPHEECSPLVSHLIFASCGWWLGFVLGMSPVGRWVLDLVL